MATVTHDTLKLCTCCALKAANDDESGCLDYYGHERHALTSPFLAASLGSHGSLVVTATDDETESIGYYECDGCDEIAIGTYMAAAILDGATDV